MIYFHLNWSKRESRKRTQFPSLFVRYMADNQIQKWGHNENHLIKVTIYSIPCIVCPLSSPRRSVIYLPPYWEPYTQTICRRLVDFRFDGSSGYLFLNSPPRDVSNKSVLTLAAHLPSLTQIFSLLHFIEDSVGKVSEFDRECSTCSKYLRRCNVAACTENWQRIRYVKWNTLYIPSFLTPMNNWKINFGKSSKLLYDAIQSIYFIRYTGIKRNSFDSI